jgi:hypothetical protein
VRNRGNSFQVLVYSGVDPVTGKPVYLTESTTDEKKVHGIQTRLTSTSANAYSTGCATPDLLQWFCIISHHAQHSSKTPQPGRL